jgi:hypothetical protein
VETIEAASENELAVLRDLERRTMLAHGVAAGDAG